MKKHLIGSDRTLKALKPPKKRLNDGQGLHIRVKATALRWYQDVSAHGKRYTVALGPYPEVGLAAARTLSEQLRAKAWEGVDLYAMRREEKRARDQTKRAARMFGTEAHQPNALGLVAADWYANRLSDWSASHAQKVLVRMNKHLLPALGKYPMSEIQTKDVAKVMMSIDRAGNADTAGRVLAILSSMFRYARVLGHVKENPCEGVGEFLRAPSAKHHAAITDPDDLKGYLLAVDSYTGALQVRAALQLGLLTLLRSSELRNAKWDEIDLEKACWLVPATRMKQSKQQKLNGRPHLVPLARQAVEILRRLRSFQGKALYVFPGQGSKNPVISENTLNKAIRSMGFSTRTDMTTHGSRATARTMLVEQLGWRSELVEMQLHHKVTDVNGCAYNRAEFESERFNMMQQWADYLDDIKADRAPRRFLNIGNAQSV